jgi:hypothetical protein
MGNKGLLLLVFATVPIFISFGSDFSFNAGGGGYLGGFFTRYTLTGTGVINGNPVEISSKQTVDQFNYGGFLFFDVPWAEFSVTIQRGNHTYAENMSGISESEQVIDTQERGTGTESMFGLSLLFKYPFRLKDRFIFFPLLGLEYQIALWEWRQPEGRKSFDWTDGIHKTNSKGEPYTLSMWNSLFVDIGAGLDFAFDPRMFLRTELLYGFRLMTPYEIDSLEMVKNMTDTPNPKLAGLTSGPTLKLALGYRLR